MSHPPRRARVLLNPTARRAARFDPHECLHRLARHGIDATLAIPPSPEAFVDAVRRAAVEEVDLLFVAGGDGSLRLAARELLHTATALAPIPVGTVNILAHETRLPRRWAHVVDTHATGQVVAMDVGTANDEAFLLMAGIGWDAAIASNVSIPLKRRIGPFAYMLEAARALPRLRANEVRLTIDGRDFTAPWGLIVIGNTRLYGGLVEFTPAATANDGLLDVCAAGPTRPGQGAELAARLLSHRLAEQPALHLDRARDIDIATPGLPVQLDGDPIGHTPMRFGILPGALRLSVPAGPLPPILPQQSAPATAS